MKNHLRDLWLEHGRLHGAEIYLLAVLIISGTIACFLLPISGGYDEEQHLMRVWEMSDYTFLPNEKLGNELPFPRVYWEMSYRRESIVRAVPPDFWKKYGNLSLDAHDYIYNINTRSVYSPPLLLPQALVMRFLGRSRQWPALTVYYICRLAGLLTYILLTLLAVRLIPYGKWILAILATSPVAILQAATITPDTISNGIAFLFIAGSLATAVKKELGRRELISLSLLFLVLFWGKVNIAPLALLPFLIIKPSQYKMRYGYYIVLIISIALFLIEVAGWNLFAYSRYHDALAGANPSAQIKFIFANPFRFSAILTNNIWMNRIDYLRAWIAIYGLDYWPVPIWTFYLYGAGLLTGLFIKGDNAPEKRTRMGLVIVYIAGYLGTIVSLYLSYTPAGSELVQGVQGRYFAGIMPLLFLALAGLPLLKQSRVPFYFPVVLAGLSLLLYVTGMYLSYHVTCGSQYYMPGLCYQPNYKNWAPNDRYSEPITKNLSLTQEIASECNRMKELRVWTDASAADPVGITEFTLSDVIRDHKVISLNVLNSKLPNKNWYTLYFPTQPDSNGKLYLLAIREDEKSKAGPRFSYSLQSEYLEGRLYENNQPVNTDLIFQAGCSAGWTK